MSASEQLPAAHLLTRAEASSRVTASFLSLPLSTTDQVTLSGLVEANSIALAMPSRSWAVQVPEEQLTV